MHDLGNYTDNSVQRASRFFQLEAAGYLGNISGYFVGSTLSTYGPWLPVSIGIAFEVIVVLLLVGSLATIPVAVYSNPVDPPKSPATLRNENTDPPPPLVKGFKQKYAALWQFLKAEKALVTILFGYFLRMLGVSVSRIFLLYVSKRFDWSFSKVCLQISSDQAGLTPHSRHIFSHWIV